VYERVLHEMTGRSLEDLGFAARRATAVAAPTPTRTYERNGGPHRGGTAHIPSGRCGIGHGRRAGIAPTAGIRAADGNARGTQRRRRNQCALRPRPHPRLRCEAVKTLQTAYEWLHHGHVTQATGRLLRSATGLLSIAVGWLSYDSGQHSDARSLYNEALAASRLARDPHLEAHSFGCLSLLAKASGRPREAVSAAQAAQSVAVPLGSPRMQALFAMREASGWALLGDRSACDASLISAHDRYAKGPRESDPAWLEFFTPAELAGLEALCRADLCQHERAAYGAEQAVLLHGGSFARNRALYTADIAVQNAVRDRPDLDAAVHAADNVLAYLPAVQSRRLLDALQEIETAMQRHTKTPAVADWLGKYRTISTN